MQGRRRQTIHKSIVVAGIIALAVLFRQWDENWGEGYVSNTLSILRSLMYIGLFSAWGLSLHRRLLHGQVRRNMLGIAGLMVFWVFVRGIKYHLAVPEDTLSRYCWYSYYIPLLFMPLLCGFVAMSLGKPETYRRNRFYNLLYIPPTVLTLFVYTNDIHQFVFQFTKKPYSDVAFEYGVAYVILNVWEFSWLIAALVMIFQKCRIPQSKKLPWQPIALFVLSILYGLAFVLRIPVLRVLCADVTVFQCLICAGVFESCIYYGLIQVNTHYDEIFDISTIGARIVDKEGRILRKAQGNCDLLDKPKRQAEERTGENINALYEMSSDELQGIIGGECIYHQGKRYSGASIACGYVVWQEEVAWLLSMLQQLKENQEELAEENSLLQTQYIEQRRIEQLMQQNKLYDEISRQTARHIQMLAELLMEYIGKLNEENKGQRGDEAECRELLGKMVVIGAYLKRRSNLIFLAAQEEQMEPRELELCFSESGDSLTLNQVEWGIHTELSSIYSWEQGMRLYDWFQECLEYYIRPGDAIFVCLRDVEQGIHFRMECAICADGIEHLPNRQIDMENMGLTCNYDEDGSLIIQGIARGGEAS